MYGTPAHTPRASNTQEYVTKVHIQTSNGSSTKLGSARRPFAVEQQKTVKMPFARV